MFNKTQLDQLDAAIRTLKAQNRVLQGGFVEQLQTQRDALDAANAGINEALAAGNYDLVSSFTTSARIAAKKIADFEKRETDAVTKVNAAMKVLKKATWTSTEVADTIAADTETTTEDASNES